METAEDFMPVITGSSSPSAGQATSSTDNAPARASPSEREEPQEEQQQERNSSGLNQRTQTDVRDTSQSIPPPNPQPPNVTSVSRDGPEEDLSTPTGEELRQMEAMANSYSALDYDHWEKSFFMELCDDPELPPVEKGRMTWIVKGARAVTGPKSDCRIIRSPPAYIGGYWWTVKFFPRGNGVSHLSLYIECSKTMPPPKNDFLETQFRVLRGRPDAVLSDCPPDVDIQFGPTDNSPTDWPDEFLRCYSAAANDRENSSMDCKNESSQRDWRVSAELGVVMYNPNEPRTYSSENSCHQFNRHNEDWGWTIFYDKWDQIHLRQWCQRQPMLRNDTLAFDVYIRVVNDPTLSLWWHPSDSEPQWDSFKHTGYMPIGDSYVEGRLEAAGLAVWLNLAPFYKIIQNVSILEHLTNVDVKPRPLCDALQTLLWGLRAGASDLRETDQITSILGNMREGSRDVITFWERLRRALELELEGTQAANEFGKLFDSPSPPLDVAVNTLPKELNSRIPVQVGQAKSMQVAINHYLGEKPGRWALPPILSVELCRNKYDSTTRRWQLLYDRVELNDEIDLTARVMDSECGKYVLYGYLAHTGPRTSDKYFSVLRPGGPESMWLSFDDSDEIKVRLLTQAMMSDCSGLDTSNALDISQMDLIEKNGHDAAVAALYIRADTVQEYLPGPQGPWNASQEMRTYYADHVFPFWNMSIDDKTERSLQVEIYSLSQYDQLPSLFHTYDLMSQAKSTNHVLYLTVPSSTTLVDLRRKVASWDSESGGPKTPPERIRLWRIGSIDSEFGPTLAFDRVSDLDQSLGTKLKNVRFWMQLVSDADAEYFSMPDPPPQISVMEDKPEGAIIERVESNSSDGPLVNGGIDSSHSSVSPSAIQPVSNLEETARERHRQPSEGVRVDDLTSVAIDPGTSDASNQRSGRNDHTPDEAPTFSAETSGQEESRPSDSQEYQRQPLPVRHVFYFIQIFDAEKQTLRTVGSFFSRLEENIKDGLRKHLGWPEDRDFLIWERTSRLNSLPVYPGATFEPPISDGTCFIVGDKLSRERCTRFALAGLFTEPSRLVEYLWAESRRHPTLAFTGTRTIEATFNSDYYSGQFVKGLYHGKGTHISDSAGTYVGDFVLGQRHGHGRLVYPSGDIYDGDWVDNKQHGQGIFIEKRTGNKYVGGYSNGKRHGKGVTYWEVADEELDLCQICYGEPQDTLFYDCGHLCACMECAQQVEICPICRKDVMNVVKVYRI